MIHSRTHLEPHLVVLNNAGSVESLCVIPEGCEDFAEFEDLRWLLAAAWSRSGKALPDVALNIKAAYVALGYDPDDLVDEEGKDEE